MTLLIRRGILALLPALFAVTAFAAELPLARDLQTEAQDAVKKGATLIVLYSRKDCPYCDTVRRNYLLPLVNAGDSRVRIVEIKIDQATALRDFEGRPATHGSLATARGIKFVPVVAFHGLHGEALAKPLVGALLPDFYPDYLETAIKQSVAGIRTR